MECFSLERVSSPGLRKRNLLGLALKWDRERGPLTIGCEVRGSGVMSAIVWNKNFGFQKNQKPLGSQQKCSSSSAGTS